MNGGDARVESEVGVRLFHYGPMDRMNDCGHHCGNARVKPDANDRLFIIVHRII
jgi:hypothetical protein